MRAGLIVTACLLMFYLPGAACAPSPGFDALLSKIVAPYRLSLIRWEFQALSRELEDLILGRDYGTADETAVVIDYFATVDHIKALERQIEATRSGIERGGLTLLGAQLNTLQTQKKALERKAERIIEEQIKETLAELGIFNPMDNQLKLEFNFPPINFVLEEPPYLLVVSPRDSIERIREVILLQGITLEVVETIEAAVDELGVSSLVVMLGGIATYPASVTSGSGLRATLNTAIEEWLHQYLFFKPLGFLYALHSIGAVPNYEIAIINETLASMTSREIGATLYQNYYSQYGQGGSQPEVIVPQFDFNQEMRDIRMAVDSYLAQGEIGQAEAFMEQKRLLLAAQGYYIRKLNQAYFAFYGTYADSPTSIDPIGVELRTLRGQSSSLREFLDTVAQMTGRHDLIAGIE